MVHIDCITEVLTAQDGKKFESVLYPNDQSSLEEDVKRWKHISVHKTIDIKKFLTCSDGSSYEIPFSETISVLPDRTGFITIFGDKPSEFSKIKTYPYFFEKPNNAAIYSADGSLRFQLTKPIGDPNEHFYMLQGHSVTYPDFPTVILQSDEQPNTSGFYNLYAIDPDNPEIINTGRMIKF